MNRITVNAQGQDISSDRRLLEIETRLFFINMIDHWTGDDRREYIKLTAEREKIRRGE